MMAQKAVFEGLVRSEDDKPLEVRYVGGEACYVVNDDGFLRYVSSEQVDRHVLDEMRKQIEGNEELLAEQTAKMTGQEDIFSRAAIEKQIMNMDRNLDTLMQTGIPGEVRAYLGMMGFKVIVNVHGEVVKIEQPATTDEGGDE